MLLLWAILGFLALFCEARVLQGNLKLIAPVPPPSWATPCLTWPFSLIIHLCFVSRRREANASTSHKGSSLILTFAYLFCVHMHTHRFACNIHMTVWFKPVQVLSTLSDCEFLCVDPVVCVWRKLLVSWSHSSPTPTSYNISASSFAHTPEPPRAGVMGTFHLGLGAVYYKSFSDEDGTALSVLWV